MVVFSFLKGRAARLGQCLMLGGALAVGACGDESENRLYATQQVPPWSEPSAPPKDVPISLPSPPLDPHMTINSTLRQCLGILGVGTEQLLDLCPPDRETHECPQSYRDFVAATEHIGAQVAEEFRNRIDVSLDDILAGHGSLEATALAVYSQQNNIMLRDDETVIAEGPSYHANLFVILGDSVEALRGYVQRGDFYGSQDEYLGNFPLEHLRCQFNDWSHLSPPNLAIASQFRYIISGQDSSFVEEMPADTRQRYKIELVAFIDDGGEIKKIMERDSVDDIARVFENEHLNIAALKYAVWDSYQDGQTWVHDLAMSTDPYHSERKAMGIVYWQNAVEWEVE